MRKLFIIICMVFLFSDLLYAQNKPQAIPLEKYLEFARTSADWTWQHSDSLKKVWQERFDPNGIWGYQPPSQFLNMATIYAMLYDIEGKKEYAERVKKVLLTYGDFRKHFPNDIAKKRPEYSNGVPALPNIFTTMHYVKPYAILKEHNIFTRSEQKKIEELISHSINYLLRTQEWGPMNRTALRAEALGWAVRAMPDQKTWRNYEQALAFDNWGNWEIEDASLYHAIWLYALLGYADSKENLKGFFYTPEMYYYAQYFLHLMCPDGMIPDYGDSNWHSNWSRYLVFFEAAAKAYNDPHLKWAASVIADKFIDFNNIRHIGLASMLLDCYQFGTDDLIPEPPKELSEEVMEDVQGKKIVFRNGWQSGSTYMLLNYRDEGDGGVLFRDYLRDAIPVEEEKMTHGHADENSIVLLMWKGSVLLHDGGYRDYMPSGPYGAYRQDYFHNRLCVRNEKIWMGQKLGEFRYSLLGKEAVPGQPVLDFLHNAGSYRLVRTQKIDFLTFPEFDYSRSRVIDDKLGYEWDRVITYIKDPEMVVVFDILKAKVEEFFTAANLWHTRKIVSQGDHWYDTQYDSLRNLGVPTENNLWIYFPKTQYRIEQVEKEKRYYQDEWVISQTTGQHFELGQHISFVTVLVPHSTKEDPKDWQQKIRFIESKESTKGLSVEIRHKDKIIHMGAKCNLRMDMIRDNRRPKYTYESGRITYDQMETNGDYFFTVQSGKKLNFTVVNLIKAVYNGHVLFSQEPASFGLAFDGTPDAPAIGKARYWRDEIILK